MYFICHSHNEEEEKNIATIELIEFDISTVIRFVNDALDNPVPSNLRIQFRFDFSTNFHFLWDFRDDPSFLLPEKYDKDFFLSIFIVLF